MYESDDSTDESCTISNFDRPPPIKKSCFSCYLVKRIKYFFRSNFYFYQILYFVDHIDTSYKKAKEVENTSDLNTNLEKNTTKRKQYLSERLYESDYSTDGSWTTIQKRTLNDYELDEKGRIY